MSRQLFITKRHVNPADEKTLQRLINSRADAPRAPPEVRDASGSLTWLHSGAVRLLTEHWIWDDASYPPRSVQGFYKKAELELLIFRRESRRRLGAGEPGGECLPKCTCPSPRP